MAYTYDAIFAVDPNSPSNVARNASILIFDPNDATKTPVTLTDITGSPIANPITVNQHGFGPAIKHATLDRLAWEGAGMSGVFTSYEGMKEEAVAARVAAQNAATSAGQAATIHLDELIAAGNFEGPAGPLTNLSVGTVETAAGNPLTDEIVRSELLNGVRTKAALTASYGDSVLVTAYGATGDGATDDKGAIDQALAALAEGGTLVFPGGKNYRTSGAHVVPVGVTIRAHGATITHTGDNICFNFNQAGSFNLKRPGGIVGANIVGNAGVDAVGVEFGNAWGLFAHNVNIGAYSSGVGLDLHNKTNWCEGSSIVAVKLDGNKIGIRFRRTTGTFSFGYTSILDVSVNVPTDGIGVDFGGTSAEVVYLYNADIRATVWPLGSNAISLRVGATFNSDNIRMHFTGEVPGNAGGTNHRGLVNEGGTLRAYGHFNIKDGANETTLGQTQVLAGYKNIDTRSGNAGGLTWQAVLSQNIDLAHNAQFGYLTGTNVNTPYVSGFDQSDAFRAYATPLNGKPAVDGKNVFRVHRLGHLYYGPTAGVSIQSGTGKPNSVATANRGSLYVRTDDAGTLAQVYVKTTDGDNAGWVALVQKRSGTTAQRPTTADTGDFYYDTSISKPLWWNGTVWKDAQNATV